MESRINILENDNEDEDFYFEAEHLALKNNSDYQTLLKTIAILQAQRAQSLKDIDKLANMKNEALENPSEFIEKLTRGEDLGFPQRVNIAVVPKIDFSKYDAQLPAFSRESNGNSVSGETDDDSRMMDTFKSNSQQRLWTVEEQKRLEELLVEFPPEPIEKRRFEKIARALGNRTCQQVTSRCQKYFKKLQLAGLPIPGRHPKGSSSQKISRIRAFSEKKSTFFPDLDVPMRMNEDEDDFWLFQPSTSKSSQVIDDDSSSQDANYDDTVSSFGGKTRK
ncbi:ZZ-type zinc finger-containing protein 3 [Sergentomyia squamirostris]